MWPLLKAMVLEEWRMHTSMFDRRLFFLFPVMLTLSAAGSTLFFPLMRGIISGYDMALMGHYMFLLFGMSIGAFGLIGGEMLTQRFGKMQLVATTMRILPITDRASMAVFFMKDVLFYMLLWVIPALLGFSGVAPWVNIPLKQVGLLMVSLPLSFLIGLSVMFVLSTVYAHTAKGLLILLAGATIMVGAGAITEGDLFLVEMLPPFAFFVHPSIVSIMISVVISGVCLTVSLIFPKTDFPQQEQRFSNTFTGLVSSIPARELAPYVAKDLLTLKRSDGGIGKILFTLLIPAGIVWMLLAVLDGIIPGIDFLVVFALFIGLITSSIYNWLTELDSYTYYAFLPVSVSVILKGKVCSYMLLNTVPATLIVGAAVLSSQYASLVPALLVFIGISAYTVAITVYLTGLFPTVLLYNVKLFCLYTILISPLLLVLLFLSAFNIWYLCTAFLFVPLSYYVVQEGYHRWDNVP